MNETDWLATQFEQHRPRLRAVAYRMLGSMAEADDAVQDAWLRVSRADADDVDNVAGWLTTIVARVSLNMLRSRDRRRETSYERAPEPVAEQTPEQEAVMADSVGLALLVVLDTLTPPERLAFVLHDTFGVPFDEIAPLVGRTPTAARQLASRARRRVRGGASAVREPDVARQRRVVDAYLAATRDGDFEALVRLLHPDVELYADAAALPTGRAVVIRGAEPVARGAMASSGRARFTGPALVAGAVGLVMAPQGRLFVALAFAFDGDLIARIDVIGDADRLRDLDLAVLD
ncbi:sigma-70 family RNA polymerase sigma factor [Luteipulveratus halotolerans]|uniref:RNA polymerase sigma 70 n=1 Tax=Luteipulveratus halotolerans TaxID=1631356 RepID=A0A0L6CM89_9MICO|nr:sigma-70 family RNA polymerase sigma factor [Luteipulveratus halotolerans]KNX38643.1 RNA polymerase sigma 70 [Luteipulveratus halotolerans]